MTTSIPTRFVALDVHRKYLVVGAVDAGQKVLLSPRRFGFEAFEAWAPTHLTPSDLVVLEATANAWLLYDQVKPFVADVLVAHPQAVKLISAARVKTDSRDTIKLASLLAANLIPAIWVPLTQFVNCVLWSLTANGLFSSAPRRETVFMASCIVTISPCPQASLSQPISVNGGSSLIFLLPRSYASNKI